MANPVKPVSKSHMLNLKLKVYVLKKKKVVAHTNSITNYKSQFYVRTTDVQEH